MKTIAPTWLRGAEIFAALAAHGLDRAAAIERLGRELIDDGIVKDREADPASDLFRLAHIIRWHAVATWQPEVAAVRWEDFSIWAPHATRRIFDYTAIEVSRELLPRLVGASDNATRRYQRFTGDAALVEEAVQAIGRGKFANALQAATEYAKRAEGTGTMDSTISRLRKLISEALKTRS